MRIQHNIMALNAHRQLNSNNNAVSKSLEKLSSGYRINRAGDDAAGLAISEKMKAQIKGLEVAQANAQDGISLIQTAEGSLTEVHSMLNRMVELANKAANGTYQDINRGNLQDEIVALRDEIDRVAQATNFNGINLLDGNISSTGSAATVTMTGTVGGATLTGTDVPAAGAKYVSGALTYGTAASAVIKVSYTDAAGTAQTKNITFTAATSAAVSARAAEIAIAADTDLGALFKATTGATGDGIAVESKTAGAAGGAVTNIEFVSGTGITAVASGTATPTTEAVTTYDLSGWTTGDSIVVGGKTYTQADYDDLAALTTALDTAGYTLDASDDSAATIVAKNGAATGGLTLQVGDTNDSFQKVTVSVGDMSARGLAIDAINIGTQDSAAAALVTIKAAIDTVSKNRSALGALQNRLDHTISNLGVTTENLTAAEARIRDVDMAKEMMDFTKMNVLTQAAQAMLAQANQQPQSVLQLLR